MVAMRRQVLTAVTLAAVLGVGGVARAQSRPAQLNLPQRPPGVIVMPLDLQGPRPPHERQYVAPPASRAAPMERVPEIAPLSPRIGD